MLPTLLKTNFKFFDIFILSSANAFNFDLSRVLSFGKELKRDISVNGYIIMELFHHTLGDKTCHNSEPPSLGKYGKSLVAWSGSSCRQKYKSRS